MLSHYKAEARITVKFFRIFILLNTLNSYLTTYGQGDLWSRLSASQLEKEVQLVWGQAVGDVLLVASTNIFLSIYRFDHSTVLSLTTLSVKSFQINFLLIESHWLLYLKMLFRPKERSCLLNILLQYSNFWARETTGHRVIQMYIWVYWLSTLTWLR